MMAVTRVVCSVILAALLAACEVGREQSPVGAELYARYCASCHSESGRGDGPAAGALARRPADLTRSTLGLSELIRRIDGRDAVLAHGTSAMPVWGEAFMESSEAETKARRITALRLEALAAHVRSLRAAR